MSELGAGLLAEETRGHGKAVRSIKPQGAQGFQTRLGL